MAQFGACYPHFRKHGGAENTGVTLGKLVSANLTVNMATGELYADDGLAESVSEFASGTIAMEVDDMTAEKEGAVFGCTASESDVTYNKADNAPYGALAYFKTLMRNGKKVFKCVGYPKVKAAVGNDNAQTRGNSINLTSTPINFTVFQYEGDSAGKNAGDWRHTHEAATEAAAKAWVEAYSEAYTPATE